MLLRGNRYMICLASVLRVGTLRVVRKRLPLKHHRRIRQEIGAIFTRFLSAILGQNGL